MFACNVFPARWCGIGCQLLQDRPLWRLVKIALNASLPPPWERHTTTEGDTYFYNAESGESAWDHPSDDEFKAFTLEADPVNQEEQQLIQQAKLSREKRAARLTEEKVCETTPSQVIRGVPA